MALASRARTPRSSACCSGDQPDSCSRIHCCWVSTSRRAISAPSGELVGEDRPGAGRTARRTSRSRPRGPRVGRPAPGGGQDDGGGEPGEQDGAGVVDLVMLLAAGRLEHHRDDGEGDRADRQVDVKTQRQLRLSTKNPPSSGPATLATPNTAPNAPWYLACRERHQLSPRDTCTRPGLSDVSPSAYEALSPSAYTARLVRAGSGSRRRSASR